MWLEWCSKIILSQQILSDDGHVLLARNFGRLWKQGISPNFFRIGFKLFRSISKQNQSIFGSYQSIFGLFWVNYTWPVLTFFSSQIGTTALISQQNPKWPIFNGNITEYDCQSSVSCPTQDLLNLKLTSFELKQKEVWDTTLWAWHRLLPGQASSLMS